MSNIRDDDTAQVSAHFAVYFLDRENAAFGLIRFIDRDAPEDVGLIPEEAAYIVIRNADCPAQQRRYRICRDESAVRNALRMQKRERGAPTVGPRVRIFED